MEKIDYKFLLTYCSDSQYTPKPCLVLTKTSFGSKLWQIWISKSNQIPSELLKLPNLETVNRNDVDINHDYMSKAHLYKPITSQTTYRQNSSILKLHSGKTTVYCLDKLYQEVLKLSSLLYKGLISTHIFQNDKPIIVKVNNKPVAQIAGILITGKQEG